jgi:MFS family permease
MLLLIALITSSTNGYDGSMMNGLQALTNWKNKVRLASDVLYQPRSDQPSCSPQPSSPPQFNDPSGGTKGLLNAVQNIGAIAGLPLAPYVTDGLGRRAGILIGSIIMLAGVAMQATCNTIGVFIASRGLIGESTAWVQQSH